MNAGFRSESQDGAATLVFSGRLDATTIGALWDPALAVARVGPDDALRVDLTSVVQCDTAGVTLLAAIEAAHGRPITLIGAARETVRLLETLRGLPPEGPAPPAGNPLATQLRAFWLAATSGLVFLGQTAIAITRLPRHLRMLRWSDVLAIADTGGVRALPLVLMLGFGMGLILAFEASIPLRRLGADAFVIRLVSVSMARELAAVTAAVIFAGRTGSAFAAEIGTMQVNEEVAALATMGVDPVTMLVLPRLIASVLVLPGLALALDLAGVAGMTVVMNALGYPVIGVLNQARLAVGARDLVGGLFKAFCFGLVIAAIGCRSGLAAGIGPRAVGQAATAAVVGGIVGSMMLDGVFAVLFFRLGL